MSPRSRRLLAWLFVLVFVVVAWRVVIQAAGLQWTGWHQGFTRSGVIVISSTPRATVYLNGKDVGTTPKRMGDLVPGLVQIELRASGRGSWRQTVRIVAGQALVIGPVALFPPVPKITRLDASHPLLVDNNDNRAWTVVPQGDHLIFTENWPEHSSFSLPITTIPDNLAVSPHQQVAVTWSGDTTTLSTLGSTSAAWTMPAIDDAWWLPDSDAVVYGRRDGQLHQFDTVTKTDHVIGPALQAGPMKNDVWRSVSSSQGTTILRQSPVGSAIPVTIDTCLTACQVSSGPDGTLVVKEKNGVTHVDTPSFAQEIQHTPLATTDQVFWFQANHPPLWTSGIAIWTLDNQHQPTLLDRHADTITDLRWLEVGNLLLIVDTEHISLVSVSARQGHGVVFQTTIPKGYTVTRIATDVHSALMTGPAGPEIWQW